MNYYNRSVNSEASQENFKENKMLKDALYATIKLVLDQNKQIRKLKEAVTHRNRDKSKDGSASRNDDSLLPDLSLLSISKDGINPLEAVNNFLKEHMPTNKSANKVEILKNKYDEQHDNSDMKSTSKKDFSQMSQNDIESVNEVNFHI